ncbi:MAG TPA: adenylate/guanylate cyclase domain-containing protein [Planctomycetota bacterium]|nr:adenylate/guanylate cyclase domain-containing protein [Planctomycetota bacterium]
MFTDLVGSVKMYNKVSDSIAVELVRSLETQVVEVLPKYRGKMIKSTGDGQLLTFEDAPNAAKAAQEVHRLCDLLARNKMTDIFVRIALNTGEVFQGDTDIHGNSVNLAARLLTVCGACETTVTAETWGTMQQEDRKGFLPHGPEVFKGFTRYTRIYKKPNPNPLTDVTFRPESLGGDDTSLVVTESMPKHQRYVATLDHPQGKKTFEIKEGETHVLGRAPECNTVVTDKMFSGTHMALAVVDGVLWVFDLQSSNGITFRGKKIKRRKPVSVNDMIQLPTGNLQFKLP